MADTDAEENRNHWAMRTARALGYCAGVISAEIHAAFFQNRLVRLASAFLATGWIAKFAGFHIAEIALFVLALVLYLADLLIDEVVKRLK